MCLSWQWGLKFTECVILQPEAGVNHIVLQISRATDVDFDKETAMLEA